MSYSQTHTHFMDLPNNCGCDLPGDHRGSSGWHFRPKRHPDSDARNFEAYERCPAWAHKAGLTIDPTDRRRFLVPEQTKRTRGVKA